MNATLLAALTADERHLVSRTERDALADLDEDEVLELHQRVRRARTKYVGQYRRGASARVPAKGSRGAARPANDRARVRAEAFEEALARVSRRLAVLANESARELRSERVEAARSVRWGVSPGAAGVGGTGAETAGAAAVPAARDRTRRTPATEKRRASTQATGARRQARRDAR